MFGFSKCIVILPDEIRVVSRSNNTLKTHFAQAWQEDTFLEVWTQAIGMVSQLRVLVSDELAYVITREVSTAVDSRKLIQEELAQDIPESLTELLWDFKVVSKEKNTQIIQAYALTLQLSGLLKEAATVTNHQIPLVLPISLIFLDDLEVDVSTLLLHKDELSTIACLIHKGAIYVAFPFDSQSANNVLQHLLDLAHKQGVKPRTVIISGEFSEQEIPDNQKLELIKHTISPVANFHKHKIHGKDEDALAIKVEIDRTTRTEKAEDDQVVASAGKQGWRWLLFVVVVALFGLIIGSVIVLLQTLEEGVSFPRFEQEQSVFN